jgi:uncharacterized membrane protein (UPF0127 family)
MKYRIPIAAFVLAAAAAVTALQGKNPDRIFQLADLKTATITIGTKKLKVWLMDTPTKRNEGMMFLSDKDVKPNDAMLFVFPSAEPRGFWMRNTRIPLDIAFMDGAGKILNTAQMKPFDESSVPSKGPAKFVLEMKKGAFKRLGIKAGMKATIPKTVKAPY